MAMDPWLSLHCVRAVRRWRCGEIGKTTSCRRPPPTRCASPLTLGRFCLSKCDGGTPKGGRKGPWHVESRKSAHPQSKTPVPTQRPGPTASCPAQWHRLSCVMGSISWSRCNAPLPRTMPPWHRAKSNPLNEPALRTGLTLRPVRAGRSRAVVRRIAGGAAFHDAANDRDRDCRRDQGEQGVVTRSIHASDYLVDGPSVGGPRSRKWMPGV